MSALDISTVLHQSPSDVRLLLKCWDVQLSIATIASTTVTSMCPVVYYANQHKVHNSPFTRNKSQIQAGNCRHQNGTKKNMFSGRLFASCKPIGHFQWATQCLTVIKQIQHFFSGKHSQALIASLIFLVANKNRSKTEVQRKMEAWSDEKSLNRECRWSWMFRQEDLSLPEQQLASLQRVLVRLAHCLPTSKWRRRRASLCAKKGQERKKGRRGHCR